MSKEAVEI